MKPKFQIPNEELIEKFRDWRSRWKMPDAELEGEVSFVSKLAEFMAPVPLSKVTKAVMQDFYLEERMRQQVMRAIIAFDAFRAEMRKGKL